MAMDTPYMSPGFFWLFSLHAILLSCMNFFLPSESTTIFTNETDLLALLSFKDQITQDPLGALNSWNSTLHFCDWSGVTCSSRHPQRVKILNITDTRLVGSISPHIANLTFLRFVNLSGNALYGVIPPEVGHLFRLRYLGLSGNSLGGEIPINLTNCGDLKAIDLYQNQLIGKIPSELGSLSNLVHLYLGINNLTGSIPPSLGNLSSLTILDLSQNRLVGGVPNDLSRLLSLRYFQVNENQLSGMIPPLLYNISSIVVIDVTANQLHGRIPVDIGHTLPYLENLYLGGNQFTGPIPTSLANASGLQALFLGHNMFTGPIPANLGGLQSLWRLSFSKNQLGSGDGNDDLGFINSLSNCTILQKLGADNNLLKGVLPSSIANLSTQLTDLHLGNNLIFGSVPVGIENLVRLDLLALDGNLLTGSIPAGIGKLVNLEALALASNRISGQIPSSIGNITRLSLLYLFGNGLEGGIPSSLGNCRHLEGLDLSNNYLNGTIPKEVLAFSSETRYINLSHNSLTGSLLLEANDVKHLLIFDVAKNRLSGEIPRALGNFHSLEYLDMDTNFFHGTISSSLSGLKSIQFIDLSHNNLSGQIPKYLEKFSFLQYLNLSFNDLEGEVPKQGVFRYANAVSVLGNKNLCGGIHELNQPPCPKQASKKRGKSLKTTVKIAIVSVVLFLILLTCVFITLYWIRKRRHEPSSVSSMEDRWLQISYADLLKATDGFSPANLVGMGSYGSVYKGTLDRNQMVVAVKVLNLQRRGASKTFIAECEALRHLRHRNLVKIISACSSIDFKGNDFKALVFEYMPNGSLDKWLHPVVDDQHQLRNLNLIQRLNIAIDVASSLDYLHHHCQTPVVHCDLKPNNILLDNDMIAHVGDFGLATFLSEATNSSSHDQTSSIAIKGSIGYVAPEYGVGSEVSTQGDVYSYGILLLEMFTGKSPTNDMFKDDLSLHQFVEMALPERVMEIADQQLFLEVESIDRVEIRNMRSRIHDCLISVFKIGLLSSKESLRDRMAMKDVATKMLEIRDLYLGVGIHREKRNKAPLLDEGTSYISNY